MEEAEEEEASSLEKKGKKGKFKLRPGAMGERVGGAEKKLSSSHTIKPRSVPVFSISFILSFFFQYDIHTYYVR